MTKESLETVSPRPDPAEGVILAPSYGVAGGVMALGLLVLPAALWWGPALWLALVVALFGVFLLLQTVLLRLQFTDEALVVWRQGDVLRRFPYAEWIGWTLFWAPVPVLFYFREQRSIHFLPVLFDASELRRQLSLHLP